MHILIGGTGHVGSAAAMRLLEMGEPVTIVSRSDRDRREWEQRGARLAIADVLDPDALREVLAGDRGLSCSTRPPIPRRTPTHRKNALSPRSWRRCKGQGWSRSSPNRP